ncbi:zf-DHHC-domain-containing protein, partial [Rozella allomycis CSF55]
YKASTTDPGIITHQNHRKMLEMFEFDYVLYFPDNECRTCLFPKPARSKHCSLCDSCISLHDHHCAWINNCVGMNNHIYFIAYLIFLTISCIYVCFSCNCIIKSIWTQIDIGSWLIMSGKGEYRPLHFYEKYIVIILLKKFKPALLMIFLFTLLVSVVVCVFTIYHLQMICRGITTNESFKWSDVDVHLKSGKSIQIPLKTMSSESSLRTVYTVKDIENIYDKGILGNLTSIFIKNRGR